MKQDVNITIRRFERKDIPKKVEWINNPENNRFLHYDLPLTIEKTEKWFDSHEGDSTRFDVVIEADGVPIGIGGLLSIDQKNGKAEYYITMGETDYKGKGIAKEASKLILAYGFEILGLNRIYFYTEIENEAAQKMHEKVGFVKEGRLRQDIFSHGKKVDQLVYGFLSEDWSK